MPVQLLQSFTATSRVPNCSMCGRDAGKTVAADSQSPDRPVLGLGIDIDMEGTVDICLDCAQEIGNAVGMISEARAKAVRESYEGTAQELEQAREELAAVRGALSAAREEARFAERREADALAEGFAAGQGGGAGSDK